ncbi:MAG: FxsA family protein [Planctomycetes bacterium]|nr:FxsA family protein [Planctomycetota bacterium]
MFLKLFLFFTLVPLTEFYLLLKLGQAIGLWPTLGVVFGTGLMGAVLAKRQGVAVLRHLLGEMEQGILPAEALFDGVLLLLAGALLITPGLLTDCLGIMLLFPPARRALKAWLRRKIEQKIARGEIRVYTRFGGRLDEID